MRWYSIRTLERQGGVPTLERGNDQGRVGDRPWCARAHPCIYRRCRRVLEVAALLHADSATAGVALQRFGPSLRTNAGRCVKVLKINRINCACDRVRRAHHVLPWSSHSKPTTIPISCSPGTSGKNAALEGLVWCVRRTADGPVLLDLTLENESGGVIARNVGSLQAAHERRAVVRSSPAA